MEQNMTPQADSAYDSLTGLANQPELRRRLRQLWLPSGTQGRKPPAVLFLDIDRFRHINEQFGRVAGDEVLATLAHRMRIWARAGDLVARVGGDTFVIVLGRVSGPREAQGASDRIRLAQLEPIAVGPHRLCVSLSVGIAVPVPGELPEATLARAEGNLLNWRRRRRSR